MKKLGNITLLASATMMLLSCKEVNVEGSRNLPVSITGDQPGMLDAGEAQKEGVSKFLASQRVPLISKIECGPFGVDLRANPMVSGETDMESAARDVGQPFEGFYLVINEQKEVSGRVRFRDLLYPGGNVRIYYHDSESWRDITSSESTSYGFETSDAYRDYYLGHDLSTNMYPFVDGKFVVWQPWDTFYQKTVYFNEVAPKGRYRVIFTSAYELEWDGGSCDFRLPDMEFTYR